MEDNKQKFYITTPIYYANGSPHLGHAYTTIAADVLARFYKREGKNVFLSVGMDEHGLKIQESAKEAGKDLQKFVDEIAGNFKELFDRLNIEYSGFIRTSSESHKKAVQKTLQFLFDKGAIKPGKYKGLYCAGCEQFITKSQLVDGKCPDHNVEPEELEEESYLLDLKNIQKNLIEKIEKDIFKISPFKRKNEILSFLKNQDLQDVAISRKKNKVSWGVELPFDSDQITYVWVDAFLNYLTVLGWDGGAEKVPEFFPPNIQLMGKDILRVHSTIWPAILIHLGIDLPKEIFAHGMIVSGGKKMSKTLGNTISPDEMIDKFGVDATRYLLMSAGTFGSDVDITMERMVEKYNADLVNGVGNVVARVTKMAEDLDVLENQVNIDDFNELMMLSSDEMKYSNNPEYFGVIEKNGRYLLKDFSVDKFRDWNALLQSPYYDFCGVIENILGIQKFIDLIIAKTKPWTLDGEEKKLIIYNCLEVIRIMSHMIYPFMPETAEKIFEKLGLDNVGVQDFESKWGSVEFKNVKKGEGLFPRI